MNYTEPKVIYTCFPGGKHKVLTMSYDDGRLEDRRLVELFNRYGIRGTFNLNGGLPRPERIPESEWVELYKGHEVACHTYHHPTISRSPLDQTARQVLADRMQLEGVMGYPVRGLAYPNGSWTPEIAALLPALGIRYARVVGDTHDFAMPHDFMTWKATCHHTHNQAVLAAAVGNLLSNLHITLLQSVDGLHTAHTNLITYTLNLRSQSRDGTLNLTFGTVELSCQIAECIAVATDGIHQETTTIVIVNLVSETTTAIVAEATPAITAPTHKEEEEDNPHKPTAFTTKAVVTLHGKKDIWVNTLLLEQRCKKTKHSIVRC